MPIPFSSIPAHIANGIVQKVDLRDFVSFSQVSRKSFEAAKNVKTRYAIERENILKLQEFQRHFKFGLIYDDQEIKIKIRWIFRKSTMASRQIFHDFPVRLNDSKVDCYSDVFTEEFCNAFIEFLANTNSTVNCIYLTKTECSADALNRLIEIGRVEEIGFSRNPSAFAKTIKGAELCFEEYMDEAEIMEVNASNFIINHSNLTSEGAHLMIKEVLAGKRNIDRCIVYTETNLNNAVITPEIPILKEEYTKTKYTYLIGDSFIYTVSVGKNFFSIEKLSS